jgi:chorismate synthase
MSLVLTQNTVTREGQEVELRGKGRHDPCVLPRAVPMVEALALTLVDALMIQKAQCQLVPNEYAKEINLMGTTARVTEADCKVHAVVANVSGQQIDEE